MQNAMTLPGAAPSSGWLKNYYFLRFLVAAAWVAAAFTIAQGSPLLAAVMLVAYPAWDALANLIDARRSGGLAANPGQRLNAILSAVTAVAVVLALGWGMHAVVAVFGIWATVSGLCQLAVALCRRKAVGAQWAMILSGAQSALAGGFMVKMAHDADKATVASVAPYAAFGAFYFLVSAVSLAVSEARRRSVTTA